MGSGTLEEGDVFFLYRPQVEESKVQGRDDAQRFLMVMCPDSARGNGQYRLWVLGRKKLPEVRPGEQHPEERHWALNIMTTSSKRELQRRLSGTVYETRTRGEREEGPAKPVGEGRYRLLRHDGHTELAYVLELPERPGRAQAEFGVRGEASYIISVKNPQATGPGTPPQPQESPRYPERLAEQFGERRWVNAEPELLAYENTQVVLIGARDEEVEQELGVDIGRQRETARTADVFEELRMRSEPQKREPLVEGEFPQEELGSEDTEQRSADEAPGRGGSSGGRKAASEAPSAAAIARLLTGASFPQRKQGLLEHAESNRQQIEAAHEALSVLQELPDREYADMADVTHELGKVR